MQNDGPVLDGVVDAVLDNAELAGLAEVRLVEVDRRERGQVEPGVGGEAVGPDVAGHDDDPAEVALQLVGEGALEPPLGRHGLTEQGGAGLGQAVADLDIEEPGGRPGLEQQGVEQVVDPALHGLEGFSLCAGVGHYGTSSVKDMIQPSWTVRVTTWPGVVLWNSMSPVKRPAGNLPST